ncbi:MAG: rod shape-determining protein MreC [Pseudomonadota bacterium]|nr:rod shape-determining protein MreC [Pseudomonadota bacterium]
MKQGSKSAQRLFQPIRGLAQRFALISLLLFAISLMVLGRVNVQMVDSFRVQVTDAFAPILNALSKPAETFSRSVFQIRELAHLREENIRLRETNLRLFQWENAALNLELENKRLRSLLNFKPGPEPSFITARIIADRGGAFAHSLIVNVGYQDGVNKGQTGMTGKGLVGRVASVGRHSARILLITDINSRIPVFVGNDRLRAILAGNNNNSPKLVHLLPSKRVKIGDRVVTSGHGGAIPPNLPVGVVTKADETGFVVQPFAKRNRLEYIRLLDYGLGGIFKGLSQGTLIGHSKGGRPGNNKR